MISWKSAPWSAFLGFVKDMINRIVFSLWRLAGHSGIM